MDRLFKTSVLAAALAMGSAATDVLAQGPPPAFGQDAPAYPGSPSSQYGPFPAPPPGAPAPVGEAATQPGAPGTSAMPGSTTGAGASSDTSATSPNAASPNAATPDMSASFSPGEGGAGGGAQSGAVMIGDQAPIFARPNPPSQPPQPGPPPRFPGFKATATKGGTVVPWVRGFKISDNQSPVPQDRVYFNFNYYNNMNYAVDRQIGSPVSGIQIYRYMLGFEKTFWSGWASFGLRDSIDTMSSSSAYPILNGSHTAMGDLTAYTKFVLYQGWDDNNGTSAFSGFGYPAQVGGRNGGLISGGLAVTMPTGPSSFAGAPFSKGFRAVNLQPYLGYFFSRGNFYLQGFESVNVPCDPNDVTMLFNDVGIGYYLFRNPEMDTFITAFAPTFETHVNIPLNHQGVYNINDPVGTSTVVDLTLGANVQFGRRTVLLLGAVTPVSGPRPFAVEATALLNFYFGGRAIPPITPAYPMAGN